MVEQGLSVVRGIPLSEEPGLGALTIGGYLRELAARFGAREALVIRSGDQRLAWSYDELLARATDIARSLIACGMGKDSRVGILMTNRPEFLSALFGVALAGGVPVALSTFSTEPELDHFIKASQLGLLLYEERVLKKDFGVMLTGLEPGICTAAPGTMLSARWPFLRHLVVLGGMPGSSEGQEARAGGAVESWDAFLARGTGVPAAVVLARADAVIPTDPGGIFFSSGTTSLPKGITHTQRAFAIQWWRWPRLWGMHEPVRAWTGNGFFWSANISMVVGTALTTGGTIVLQRYFDEEEALDLVRTEKLSFINGRPHQWARMSAAKNWADADLSSLTHVSNGEIIRAHPTVVNARDMELAFGTTETMTICTAPDPAKPAGFYAGSYGAVLAGNTLKIVDPATRMPVPIGEPGEVCIKGPTLMTGYLGKAPEQCFDEEGFYCTNDGGHVDAEGRFFWEGRLNDMIKTGGANVSPEEVDAVIARFPGVRRCQTVGVPDRLLGEMVVSCLVPLDGVTLSEEEVVAFVKRDLASFKAPRRVLFFQEDDFALTGSGKIKAGSVRALAIARIEAQVTGKAPAV